MSPKHTAHLNVESLEDRLVMTSSNPVIKYDAPPKVQSDPKALPVTWNDSMKSLQAAINEVKDLVKRQGNDPSITNRVIAERVTRIVDERITNANDINARNEEAQVSETYAAWFNANRETLGGRFTGIGSSTGDEYALRAEWAWDLGVGRCDETSAISYHILKEAGVKDVTRLDYEGGQYGIGHAFVVLGMQPWNRPGETGKPKAANIGNPATWDRDAFVVDGWLGQAINSTDALMSNWIYDGGHNHFNKVITEDSPTVYTFNKQFAPGTYASRTEEALEMIKAKAAYARKGLTVELQTPNTAEAGEFLSGKAVIRAGQDFFTKVKNSAKGVTVEVILYSGQRIVGIKTVDFKKGEYSKELVLGKDIMAQAPTDLNTIMNMKLMAREKSSSMISHPPEYSLSVMFVKVVAPTFNVDVRVIDDITGQPIDGARVGVTRLYQTAAVSSGTSSSTGSILLKDIATKDAGNLKLPTLTSPLRLNYMVNASKAGYAVTSSDMFTAPVAGQTQVITVRIAKAVDVRFKVTDYSNFPLDVATLQLTFKGETKTYQPESLGGGEFIFRGLAASKNGKLIEYQATGSCGGYVTSSMNFSCNPEAQEQSFTLRLGIPYKPYHGGDFEWRTMVASQQVGENILSVTRLSLELQCERGTNGEITWTTIKSTVLITNYRVADMNTYQQYGGTPPVYYQIEIGKELFHPEARLLPNGVVLFSAAGTSFHGLQLQLPIG